MIHIHAESSFPWLSIHSSRTSLKHIWSQSKEQGELQPFSRSFTSAVCTHQTSSTQPYRTQPPWCLLKNEHLPDACLCAKQGVTGKWPSLYPQASCWLSCTLGVWVTPSTLIAGKNCRDWGAIESWQESRDIHLILNMLFITVINRQPSTWQIWWGETSWRSWDWGKKRRVASRQLDKTKLFRWLVLYFLSGKVFCFSCLQHFLHTYNLMENRLKKD